MKKYLFFLVSVIILVSCKQQAMTPAKALKKEQNQEKNLEKIKNLDFTFYPNMVTPEFGLEVPISNVLNAYMTVSKTNIYAELPYFGHFYTRPMDRFDVPVSFTTNKFIYAVVYDEAKDVYNVTITPEDVQDVVNGNIVISLVMDKDGNATASVKTDERDEISYKGDFR